MDATTDTQVAEPSSPAVETDTASTATPTRAPKRRPTVEPLPARTDTVLDHERREEPVTLSHESVVEGEVAERLWETYRANFEPLEELAILQHCFSREEVLAELADPSITKIVGWEGDQPVGLGMVTNQLESVPQISPRYLRAKYPDHVEGDRIYFGILVAVDQGHRGLTLFNRIYLDMWQIPALRNGMLIFDICQFNREAFDTDSLVQRISSNFPKASVEIIDQQTYYAASLPNPIPQR